MEQIVAFMSPPARFQCAAAILTLVAGHCTLTASDAQFMLGWIWRKYFNRKHTATVLGVEDPSKQRIDDAMHALTEENFVLACRLLQHVTFSSVIMYVVLGKPAYVLGCFVTYMAFMMISKGYVNMTIPSIKKFLIVNYLAFIPFMWAGDGLDPIGRLAGREQLCVAWRCVLVLLHVDSGLHTPAQLGLSFAETAFYLRARGWDQFALACILSQVYTAAMAITLCVVLEYYLRQRFEAQFRSSDAESITSGFRRMLRGICDGEVLLDGNWKVQGSNCLNRLLSTQDKLRGKDFQDLLMPEEDEQRRFKDFMASSTGHEQGLLDLAPACMRVSLVDSHQARIGVDVYHVALPHLYGSEEPYHLLAIKEDMEQLPEATPLTRLHHMPSSTHSTSRRKTSSKPARSVRSARSSQSEGGGSLLQSLPLLAGMVLLLDTASEQQDIRQVHLKYKRHSEMPSLRKFTRPTDFETLRRLLCSYDRELKDPSSRPRHLPPVWIRMLEEQSRYMLARQATLSTTGQGKHRKLWLSLSDFRSNKQEPAPSELPEISEGEPLDEVP